jgi:hemerythrin
VKQNTHDQPHEQRATVLKIGDPRTDYEHELLLLRLQQLREASESPGGREEFFDRFSQLGGQLSHHFANEEALMKSIGMPEDLVAQHIHAHQHIILQYTELNLDLMNRKQVDQCILINMIHEWILDHIVAYDLKIRPFLPQDPHFSG